MDIRNQTARLSITTQDIASSLPSISTQTLFPLFIRTLGVGIGLIVCGYLGYRAIVWVINKWGKTRRIDRIARNAFSIWLGKVKLKKLKRQHVLSHSLFERVKHYVDNPFDRKDLSRLPYGNAEVYLLHNTDVVLKKTGSASWKRFVQMKTARDLCEKNSYKNLIIPKAKVYKDFIIENKLPILMDGKHWVKEQIGCYIENRGKFTAAVKEFTGFLYQSTLDDIAGKAGNLHFYRCFYEDGMVGRYDNVPLYLEEDQGKIGLIDLEYCKPIEYDFSQQKSFQKCRDAVCLFPYHLDEIIETAKKFDPNITQHREELEKQRDSTLRAFEKIYVNHLNFIKEKGLTIENPSAMIELTSDIKNRIVHKIETSIDNHELLDLDLNVVDLKKFKINIPDILDLTIRFLSESLSSKKAEEISSDKDIALHRSLLTDKKSLYDQTAKALKLYPITRLTDMEFIQWLIDKVFLELVEEKVIQLYCNQPYKTDPSCIYY